MSTANQFLETLTLVASQKKIKKTRVSCHISTDSGEKKLEDRNEDNEGKGFFFTLPSLCVNRGTCS